MKEPYKIGVQVWLTFYVDAEDHADALHAAETTLEQAGFDPVAVEIKGLGGPCVERMSCAQPIVVKPPAG